MAYDDDGELTHYIWNHYRQLFTPFELQVGRAIHWREKASISDSQMAAMINRNWSEVGNAEIEAALAEGPEAFRQQVKNRVLAEHTATVFINRCPKCDRLVRTPLARQCFWCGFDWHM